ncbi:MAG: sodium/proton-translocating pyrophosphatase [Deltaproteobacteria bacterium]|nr:sodium/proton-translocating pyrophosphatase [Deltaproteobacteria bacterium]
MAGFGYGSWLAPSVAACALGAAGVLYGVLWARPAGNAAMAANTREQAAGAEAFLREVVRFLLPAGAVVFVLVAWQLGPGSGGAFAVGALLAALAAATGARAATQTGSRVAQAARELGGPKARSTAHAGAAVSGVAVAALALLGASVTHLVLSSPGSAQELAGFALGTACVALLTRAGGVLAKAADRAADLLVRLGEPLWAPGGADPAAGLSLTGEIAADTAAAGADLFDSAAGALVAAAIVGAAGLSVPGGARPALAAFPFLLAALGLLASLAACAVLLVAPGVAGPRSVRLVSVLPVVTLVVGSFGLAALLGLPPAAAVAAALGAAVSPALGAATSYYASRRRASRFAESAQLGSADIVLAGLAAGLEGAVASVVLLGLALLAATSAAGLYGAAVCAVGLVSCAGLAGSLAAFAPIASLARRIAAAAALGSDVREMAEALHGEGVIHAARRRGFAAGAAALSGVALFCGYLVLAGLGSVDLGHPRTLIGLLIGAALPFLIAATALNGVGEVAFELVAQGRRLAREAGTGGDWTRRWAGEASRAAVGRTGLPSLTALGVPLALGMGLGAEALGGALAGAIASGTLLSFLLADAGDVWRGGRRWIESGALGGEGSLAHRAAIVGDAVGEPLKDAAGPAVQVFLKALAAASLAAAPLLPHL